MTDEKQHSRQRRQFLLAAGGAGVAASVPNRTLAQFADGRALPAHWDITADVLVIGSGFAGCAAAAAAAEAGSTVAVLEKMPAAGGNSAINLGDFAAWDSALHLRQKFKLGDDSAALVAGAGRYGKVSASLPAARTVNSRGAQSHARAQTKPASHLLEVGYERLQHLDAALLELACEHLAFLVGL